MIDPELKDVLLNINQPTCANLPAEKNRILFSSYDEAIAAGYTPCASCIK